MVQISNERQDRLCTFREVWNAALSSRRERQAPCVYMYVCTVCVHMCMFVDAWYFFWAVIIVKWWSGGLAPITRLQTQCACASVFATETDGS